MPPSPRLSLAVVLVAWVACGGRIEGTGGSGGAGGGGAGGSAACAGYDDAVSPSAVTFRVVNTTGQTVYLPGGCSEVAYDLHPASGPTDVSYGVSDGFCLQTCQDLQTESPIFCDACAPSVLEVAPGSSYDFVWDGRGLASAAMPAACYFGGSSSGQCPQFVAAPSGSYAVGLTGWSQCPDCTCPGGGAPCYGNPTGQSALTNPNTFSFPTPDLVELTFDPCAFGCPGG